MNKIGVTGGIGSGKSTVCKFFEEFGIPVYYSDEKAKTLMLVNQHLKNKIISEFGENSYSSGLLNKEYLAELVFNNPSNLSKLNNIVHPVVIQDFIEWSNQQTSLYCILESAIIFESGINSILDKVICVTASDEERFERIMKRDAISREKIIQRINNQMPESKKSQLADYVIVSGNKIEMKEKVFAIHTEFCNIL